MNFEDGAKFVKDMAVKGEKVDGIIVDCTDVWIENGAANSLFTVEFYQSMF